jgi:hypothetical protein
MLSCVGPTTTNSGDDGMLLFSFSSSLLSDLEPNSDGDDGNDCSALLTSAPFAPLAEGDDCANSGVAAVLFATQTAHPMH